MLAGQEARAGAAGPDPPRGPAAVPGRADHLDQGRVRHVARPLRRPRIPEVPAGQPGPVAGPDGPGVRGHLLQPPRRSGDPLERPWARWPPRSPRAGPCTPASPPTPRSGTGGRRDPARAGRAPAHPPAFLLHSSYQRSRRRGERIAVFDNCGFYRQRFNRRRLFNWRCCGLFGRRRIMRYFNGIARLGNDGGF